jgi:hypothetical protein
LRIQSVSPRSRRVAKIQSKLLPAFYHCLCLLCNHLPLPFYNSVFIYSSIGAACTCPARPGFDFLFSHEHRFLIAGLEVEKKPTWEERQAVYLAAVKSFLVKLKPEFATLPVVYVKSIRYDLKLLLSVECAKPKQ